MDEGTKGRERRLPRGESITSRVALAQPSQLPFSDKILAIEIVV